MKTLGPRSRVFRSLASCSSTVNSQPSPRLLRQRGPLTWLDETEPWGIVQRAESTRGRRRGHVPPPPPRRDCSWSASHPLSDAGRAVSARGGGRWLSVLAVPCEHRRTDGNTPFGSAPRGGQALNRASFALPAAAGGDSFVSFNTAATLPYYASSAGSLSPRRNAFWPNSACQGRASLG